MFVPVKTCRCFVCDMMYVIYHMLCCVCVLFMLCLCVSLYTCTIKSQIKFFARFVFKTIM